MAGISSKEVEEVVEGIDWKVPFTNFLKRGMTTSSRSTPPLESRCNQGTLSPAVRDNLFPFVEVDDDDDPCHCIFNVLLVVSRTLQGKDDDDNDDEEEDDDEDGEEDARTALLEATLPASRGDNDDNHVRLLHIFRLLPRVLHNRGGRSSAIESAAGGVS